MPHSLSIEFTADAGALVVNGSQHFGASGSGFGRGDSIVFAGKSGPGRGIRTAM